MLVSGVAHCHHQGNPHGTVDIGLGAMGVPPPSMEMVMKKQWAGILSMPGPVPSDVQCRLNECVRHGGRIDPVCDGTPKKARGEPWTMGKRRPLKLFFSDWKRRRRFREYA